MLLKSQQCSNLHKSVYYRPSWAILRERILVTCKMSWNLFVDISFVCPWIAEIAHLPFPTRTFFAPGQERVVLRTFVLAYLSTDRWSFGHESHCWVCLVGNQWVLRVGLILSWLDKWFDRRFRCCCEFKCSTIPIVQMVVELGFCWRFLFLWHTSNDWIKQLDVL